MKIAHPDFAFREAAEEACRNIGTVVEKYDLFGFVSFFSLVFCLGFFLLFPIYFLDMIICCGG